MVPSGQAAAVVTSVKEASSMQLVRQIVAWFVSSCKAGNQRMLKLYAG